MPITLVNRMASKPLWSKSSMAPSTSSSERSAVVKARSRTSVLGMAPTPSAFELPDKTLLKIHPQPLVAGHAHHQDPFGPEHPMVGALPGAHQFGAGTTAKEQEGKEGRFCFQGKEGLVAVGQISQFRT